MPYIEKSARKYLKKYPEPVNPGELNYLFTLVYISAMKLKEDRTRSSHKRAKYVKTRMLKLVKTYIKYSSSRGYTLFNDIAGAINLSDREFARRNPRECVIWCDILRAGHDVVEWLLDNHVNAYEDEKIKSNGDVY